jgi:hypothetical protein
MTVLSNRLDNICGVGTSGVLDWTYGFIGDVREAGRDANEKQKEFFGPMIDRGGQFLGGAGDLLGDFDEIKEEVDATPLVDKESLKKLNDEIMGDGLWADALNEGIDTLPGTVGETPWQGLAAGYETMGDCLKDIADNFADGVAGGLAQGVEGILNNATPDFVCGKFDAGLRSGQWFIAGVIGIRTPQVTLYEERIVCVEGELFLETFGGWFEGQGINGSARAGGRVTAGPKGGGGGVYLDVGPDLVTGEVTVGVGYGTHF